MITSKAIEDAVALTAKAQEAKNWKILDVQNGLMSRSDLDKLLKVNEVRTFAQMVDRVSRRLVVHVRSSIRLNCGKVVEISIYDVLTIF